MVLFIKKSGEFPRISHTKLDQSEKNSLKSFQSYLSESFHQLIHDQRHGSTIISLNWFIPCFRFLQGINRAFAKLVKDLDYPVHNWKENLAEYYLSYSLNMLDDLNSISSSISHLGISRLTLHHAISLIHNSPPLALQHLKPIIPRKNQGGNPKKNCVINFNCDKERVIYEALVKLKGISLLILRVLLCGLSKEDLGSENSVKYEDFDFQFDEKLMVKEIEEVNEAVKEIEDGLIEGKRSSKNDAATKELKKKLGELESLLEMVNKEVNCLFSEVLARRSELMDCIRLPKSNN